MSLCVSISLSCNQRIPQVQHSLLLFDTLTIDSTWNYELSRDLIALGEKSLFNDTTKKGEIWRFTVTGSFNEPYCFRAVATARNKSNTTIQATYKEGSRIAADTTIPKYMLQTTKSTDFDSSTNARWKRFQELVYEFDFWNQRTQHGECEIDAPHSILEARVNGKYHAIMSCGDVRQNAKLEHELRRFLTSLLKADELLDKARWINEGRYSISGDTLY
jgi:hypothetical protein